MILKPFPMKFLADSEIAELRERVAMFLSERGVELQHPGMLEQLEGCGARVDGSSALVRFPLKLQEQALRSVPRTFSLAAQPPGVPAPGTRSLRRRT